MASWRSQGQAALELVLTVVATLVLLAGTIKVFAWVNQGLVQRQVAFQHSRVAAGSTHPGLANPYQQPPLKIFGQGANTPGGGFGPGDGRPTCEQAEPLLAQADALVDAGRALMQQIYVLLGFQSSVPDVVTPEDLAHIAEMINDNSKVTNLLEKYQRKSDESRSTNEQAWQLEVEEDALRQAAHQLKQRAQELEAQAQVAEAAGDAETAAALRSQAAAKMAEHDAKRAAAQEKHAQAVAMSPQASQLYHEGVEFRNQAEDLIWQATGLLSQATEKFNQAGALYTQAQELCDSLGLPPPQ